MNVEELQPIKGKLIVEIIKETETETSSGIILGVASQEEEQHPHDTVKARVVAAGINSERIHRDTIIYYEHRHSQPIFNDDYKVIKAIDVLAIDPRKEETNE